MAVMGEVPMDQFSSLLSTSVRSSRAFVIVKEIATMVFTPGIVLSQRMVYLVPLGVFKEGKGNRTEDIVDGLGGGEDLGA